MNIRKQSTEDIFFIIFLGILVVVIYSLYHIAIISYSNTKEKNISEVPMLLNECSLCKDIYLYVCEFQENLLDDP